MVPIMKSRKISVLSFSVLSLFLFTSCGDSKSQNESESLGETETLLTTEESSSSLCLVDPSWISDPSLPNEIPNGGEDFCDFYQFSWQSFLYLMSPSGSNPELRNFELSQDYPILDLSGNSCESSSSEPKFFVRTVKDDDPSPEFMLPERIGQAGGDDTIYDQNSNVIFYSVQFGRSFCGASSSGNLPSDTIELKLAWKILNESEKADYLWIDADIDVNGTEDKQILGLVGFHLVRGTSSHPELVWSSFEHMSNAPNCIEPSPEPDAGWSFLSVTCSSCLATPDASCFNSCSYNSASPATSLTGSPSEICRIFPEGTASGDNKGEENIAIVDTMNTQLVGPSGLLTGLPTTDPMRIIGNYMNIGALWVSDVDSSATLTNQRGSLRLENPVMETTFQGSLVNNGSTITASTNGGLNCFTCHSYTPDSTASTGLSHIFGPNTGAAPKE